MRAISRTLTPADAKHPLLPPTAEELKKQKQTKKSEFDPLSGSYDPLTYGMNAKGEFENDEDEPIVCYLVILLYQSLFPCAQFQTFFTQSHLAAYSEQGISQLLIPRSSQSFFFLFIRYAC